MTRRGTTPPHQRRFWEVDWEDKVDDLQWFLESSLPSLGCMVKTTLGLCTVLYILNQKHMLPRPLSAVVSKVLFWPTLPLTVVKRWGNWYDTIIDEKVMLGGAPFGFAGIPEKLYKEYGVRSVINLCEEYEGPVQEYKRLGIQQLWLPTTDHFEPSVRDLASAVEFIEKQNDGERVYVHCRAGHGRSAAVVLAYMMAKNHKKDKGSFTVKDLNRQLGLLRNVRKGLWKQPNILRFQRLLRVRRPPSEEPR